MSKKNNNVHLLDFKTAMQKCAQRYGVSLFLMFVLTIQLFSLASGDFTTWLMLFHKVSYQEFGFISKAFVGSVVHLIAGENVSISTIYIYVLLLCLLGIVLASLWLGGIVSRANKHDQHGVLYFAVLFCFSPFFLRHLFMAGMFGKMDIVMVLCFIAACWLITTGKMWALGVVPAVCLVAMLSHHGFYFLFFPSVFFLAMYSMKKAAHLWISRIFFFIISLGFLFLQFGAKPTMNMEAFSQHVGTSGDPVFLEYYGTLADHWNFLSLGIPKIIRFLVDLMILSPFIALIGFVWWKADVFTRTQTQGEKARRWIWCIAFGPLVLCLPLFLGRDWGRWIAAILTSQCAVLLVLTSLGNSPVRHAFQELSRLVEKWPLYAIMLLIYAIVLPGSRERGVSFPRFNEMKQLEDLKMVIP